MTKQEHELCTVITLIADSELWALSLVTFLKQYHCTCSVLTKSLLLTAAHTGTAVCIFQM